MEAVWAVVCSGRPCFVKRRPTATDSAVCVTFPRSKENAAPRVASVEHGWLSTCHELVRPVGTQ